jgi:uncharacterized protein
MKEKWDLRFEVKAIAEDGTFEGLAAVYGNTDLQGDVIAPGAFTRTLADHGNQVPLLWQHNMAAPIGKATLTDTPAGLAVKGKLALGVSVARDAYESLKAGILSGLSIGFDTIRATPENGKRVLKELRLFEISLVTFAANPEAMVTAVKADREDTELCEIGKAIWELSQRFKQNRPRASARW